MEAETFLREKNRMCKNVKCDEDSCPLFKYNGCIGCLKDNEIKEAISAVEEWSKSHPIKTRQSDFLKLYPNARIIEGIIDICPQRLGYFTDKECYHEASDCAKCQHEFWMEEII